jgi:hypothetical protein
VGPHFSVASLLDILIGQQHLSMEERLLAATGITHHQEGDSIHHKVALYDRKQPSINFLVVTGSVTGR